ncbi:MAG: glycerol-3-phosphate 1-O-acyltransferase PlsY [Chloroherpetonaceae bacterium]|nr:glycerol-3-phosphate 1-O-acyltransferase PlsY [Chloroherpetonaceae bacterium]
MILGSYLLGSLPVGLWVGRRWKGLDVRQFGSGNIGATNVGRVCGPVAGGFVLVCDVLKGLLPPMAGAAMDLSSPWQILAALVAILGHNYSVWLCFKGGKGIATSLGALLGIAPPVALTALLLFGIEILLLRWVSLGALLGAFSLPVLMPLYYPGDGFRLAFGVLACILAVLRHRSNIQRLLAGTEPRVHLPWSGRSDADKPVSTSVQQTGVTPSGTSELRDIAMTDQSEIAEHSRDTQTHATR